MTSGSSWMHWYDDNPKRKLAEKVALAIRHYKERFCRFPARVLISAQVEMLESDKCVDDVLVFQTADIPYPTWFYLVDPDVNLFHPSDEEIQQHETISETKSDQAAGMAESVS